MRKWNCDLKYSPWVQVVCWIIHVSSDHMKYSPDSCQNKHQIIKIETFDNNMTRSDKKFFFFFVSTWSVYSYNSPCRSLQNHCVQKNVVLVSRCLWLIWNAYAPVWRQKGMHAIWWLFKILHEVSKAKFWSKYNQFSPFKLISCVV